MTNLANFNFLVVLDTSEEDESDLDMNVEMTFLLGLKWWSKRQQTEIAALRATLQPRGCKKVWGFQKSQQDLK